MGVEKSSVLWSASVGGKRSSKSSESMDSGRASSSDAVVVIEYGICLDMSAVGSSSIQLVRGGVDFGGESGWVAVVGIEVMFCCCAAIVIDLVSQRGGAVTRSVCAIEEI